MNTAKIMKFERPEAPTEGKRMEGGFIQIPNDVFDVANICLKGNMKDVFLAVTRKTCGFHKQEDDVTITQLAKHAGIERSNASTAFHALIKKKIISTRPGKFGFIVKINPVSEWDLSEKERMKFIRAYGNHTYEIHTGVLDSYVSAYEIHTHKIQPPKDKNIYSSSSETSIAEHPAFAVADATAPASAEVDLPDNQNTLSEEAAKQASQSADNRKRFAAIAEVFNRVFDDCPAVRKVSLQAVKTNAKRMRLVPAAWAIAKQRIADWQDGDGLIDGEAPAAKHCIEWFALYFEQCKRDSFVNGTGGRSKGHENWKPGFEYLMRADVMEARVFEGA